MATVAENPLVSVITVNYNGAEYLPELLDGLKRQTYRPFEVLLVDNGSTDSSLELVRGRYPWVTVIRAQKNLGFAGGNNLGMKSANGQLFALINNDAVPTPDWLVHLVNASNASDEIAAVGSKILFARPYLQVDFSTSTFDPAELGLSPDSRKLGVFISTRSSFEGCSYRKPVFRSGSYGYENLAGEHGCWTGHSCRAFLPFEPLKPPRALNLFIYTSRTPQTRSLRVAIAGTEIAAIQLRPGWQELRVTVPLELPQRYAVDILNNAGSFLTPDGAAGDRGIFEPDQGQYDIPEDVEAVCGCAMLVSRSAIDQVGAFDRDFFMYFEDMELSWRLRKQGLRLLYEPKSVVRHLHASTSVEWSDLFNFFVTRNRMLTIFKHAPLRVGLLTYAGELLRILRLLTLPRSVGGPELRTRLRVQRSLLSKTPRACLKRLGCLPH